MLSDCPRRLKTIRAPYDSAHLALFITLAALLVQVLGFALWCTVAVVAMYLRCVDAEVGELLMVPLSENVLYLY